MANPTAISPFYVPKGNMTSKTATETMRPRTLTQETTARQGMRPDDPPTSGRILWMPMREEDVIEELLKGRLKIPEGFYPRRMQSSLKRSTELDSEVPRHTTQIQYITDRERYGQGDNDKVNVYSHNQAGLFAIQQQALISGDNSSSRPCPTPLIHDSTGGRTQQRRRRIKPRNREVPPSSFRPPRSTACTPPVNSEQLEPRGVTPSVRQARSRGGNTVISAPTSLPYFSSCSSSKEKHDSKISDDDELIDIATPMDTTPEGGANGERVCPVVSSYSKKCTRPSCKFCHHRLKVCTAIRRFGQCKKGSCRYCNHADVNIQKHNQQEIPSSTTTSRHPGQKRSIQQDTKEIKKKKGNIPISSETEPALDSEPKKLEKLQQQKTKKKTLMEQVNDINRDSDDDGGYFEEEDEYEEEEEEEDTEYYHESNLALRRVVLKKAEKSPLFQKNPPKMTRGKRQHIHTAAIAYDKPVRLELEGNPRVAGPVPDVACGLGLGLGIIQHSAGVSTQRAVKLQDESPLSSPTSPSISGTRSTITRLAGSQLKTRISVDEADQITSLPGMKNKKKKKERTPKFSSMLSQQRRSKKKENVPEVIGLGIILEGVTDGYYKCSIQDDDDDDAKSEYSSQSSGSTSTVIPVSSASSSSSSSSSLSLEANPEPGPEPAQAQAPGTVSTIPGRPQLEKSITGVNTESHGTPHSSGRIKETEEPVQEEKEEEDEAKSEMINNNPLIMVPAKEYLMSFLRYDL